MKKLIIIALVIAVGAVFVNDVGRFTRARYNLDEATNYVVDETASAAGSLTRDKAAMKAAGLAQEEGIRVYQYNQNGTGVEVWTEIDVAGTWVLARYSAWRQGRPSGTAYVLRDYGSSVYR